MSNSVNLSLDVTKTGIQNPLIKVRQGDGGFETLRTTVTANGEPMDLQGWTITFMGTTAGNHKIVDANVTVVEAPNGIFDYTPSKAWGMDIGDFKIAYFKFVKGDGSASSANFRVSVIEAVDLTQEEAKNYISVVDTTIATINKHLNDSLANVTQSIADANANANTVASNATSLGNRVDNYNNKLAAIQVGARNYILNSKRALAGSGNLYDNGWVYSSMPISTFSNNKITVSVQVDYDNVTSLDGPSRIGFEVSANQNNTDGTTVKRFFSAWRFASVGESFHGRIYTTFDMSNINFESLDTSKPNAWGGGLYIQGITGTNVSVSNPKIEIGNVPTDWTPAPEAVPSNDAQLVHKTGTETIAGDKTFTSPINGNAATATKWQTARTLALTGDVTGSVVMDGSGNVSMATNGDNLVHKTGTETIAGDKTFTGKTTVNNLINTSSIATPYYVDQNPTTFNFNTSGGVQFMRVGNTVTAFYRGIPATANNVTLFSGLPVRYRPVGQSVQAKSPQGVITINANGEIFTESTYTAGGYFAISYATPSPIA